MDGIIEKYNFMTQIPETGCLKILYKYSFVAKICDVTNTFQIHVQKNECYILTNHIRSHVKASDYKLTLMISV